ncbi:MAG: hypothetical protein IKW37_01325 [Bacteroidaceae bacterium]|nr:hypothetical protein [Bacteroidaceae bacterium]
MKNTKMDIMFGGEIPMSDKENMTKRIEDIFKRKNEISLNKDIFPIILDIYYGLPVDRAMEERMNHDIETAMNEVRNEGIFYMAYPKIEKIGMEMVATDMIYKRL